MKKPTKKLTKREAEKLLKEIRLKIDKLADSDVNFVFAAAVGVPGRGGSYVTSWNGKGILLNGLAETVKRQFNNKLNQLDAES